MIMLNGTYDKYMLFTVMQTNMHFKQIVPIKCTTNISHLNIY